MFEISKKFSFYSMVIISAISCINIAILYWFPTQLPLGLYCTTGLTFVAFAAKAYYLLPICFAICALLLWAAWSFRKERIVLPIISLICLLCDFAFLAYNFFGAWFTDGHFIAVQALQVVTGVVAIAFVVSYLVLVRKEKANKRIGYAR